MYKFLILLSFVSCSTFKKIKFNKPVRENNKLSLAWSENLDPSYLLGNLPIGWVTPLINGQKVYVGSLEGKLRIFNLDDGRLLKEISEGGAIQGKPLVIGDVLYYGTVKGELIARDTRTYKEIFRRPLNAPLESELSFHKNKIFLQLRNHALVALDSKSGKVIWSYKRAVPFLTTLNRVSTPVIYKNKLLVGFADGFLTAFKISNGDLLWETKVSNAKKFADIDINPKVINDKVWIGSLLDDVMVLNPRDGTILRRIQKNILAAPVFYKNNIILLTDNGEVVVCDKLGGIKKSLKMHSNGFSSAVIWNDKLAASTTDGKVMYFDENFLKAPEKFELGHSYSSVFGYLESDGENLAVYSSRNRLYIFR